MNPCEGKNHQESSDPWSIRRNARDLPWQYEPSSAGHRAEGGGGGCSKALKFNRAGNSGLDTGIDGRRQGRT